MYPHPPFTVVSYLGACLGLGHICDSRCQTPSSPLRMQIFVGFADGTFYPVVYTILGGWYSLSSHIWNYLPGQMDRVLDGLL
jgi:hypothetical protein